MRRYALLARGAAAATLFAFWLPYGAPLSGVFLGLLLAALSIVRYRFAAYRWLAPAEALACLLFATLWSPALLGLWLPVIGLLERAWAERERRIRAEGDADRARLLELERMRSGLMEETARASARAEIAERSRIAQDIHDHVGHELSGALIALRTVERLADAGSRDEAGELLSQAIERVARASEELRETVHNLRPEKVSGADRLGELCARFSFCPVGFACAGDFSRVTSAQWQLFAALLKEALTNISRHSGATRAHVRLNANPRHVRLAIWDNGRMRGEFKLGLGLSGMRDRARIAGGSLAVDASDGFRITCVLPIGGGDEGTDC